MLAGRYTGVFAAYSERPLRGSTRRAGRIHAAVLDACQYVVPGHSSRDFDLQLHRNPGANYCNGLGYGLKVGDVASIDLEPRTTGISLAFGQTEQASTPTAKDCKGDQASTRS